MPTLAEQVTAITNLGTAIDGTPPPRRRPRQGASTDRRPAVTAAATGGTA